MPPMGSTMPLWWTTQVRPRHCSALLGLAGTAAFFVHAVPGGSRLVADISLRRLWCGLAGIWKDKEGLSAHLRCPGAAKVLLTAPGKGIPNLVAGVNEHMITAEDSIFSAASCTTNAITPVIKVMLDKYGLTAGHIETIHSYTNDQNLVDNLHKSDRRGRAAAMNMVITETGAGKAVSKAQPYTRPEQLLSPA